MSLGLLVDIMYLAQRYTLLAVSCKYTLEDCELEQWYLFIEFSFMLHMYGFGNEKIYIVEI